MSVLLNVVFIQIIVCYIIDLSGFIQSVETGLSKLLKFVFRLVDQPYLSDCGTSVYITLYSVCGYGFFLQ